MQSDTTTGTAELIKRLREPPSGGNEHYGSEAYRRKVLAPAADALEAADRERKANPVNTATDAWAKKQADAICDLHDTSFADTVNDAPLRAEIAAALTLAAAGAYAKGHNAPNWRLQSARLEGRKESAAALAAAERVIAPFAKAAKTVSRTHLGGHVTADDQMFVRVIHLYDAADWLARYATDPVCPDCNDTGLRDSGGEHPWGEAVMVPCDHSNATGQQQGGGDGS